MSWIVGLMILGFGLVMVEIFVPGGIVGIFGGLCMLAAVAVAYNEYQIEGALLTFVIGIVGLVICLVFEFKVLPKTPMGKRLFLDDTISGKSQSEQLFETFVGKEGTTATALSPTGYVLVDGKRLEAYSKSGFLERGDKIRVESFDQFKVTVSKI